jgi:hypothetical protein
VGTAKLKRTSFERDFRSFYRQKMAYASYPAAPPVATDEVMGGAEEYLDTIADDVPLFTNTREGVYSQVMPHSPNPMRTNLRLSQAGDSSV